MGEGARESGQGIAYGLQNPPHTSYSLSLSLSLSFSLSLLLSLALSLSFSLSRSLSILHTEESSSYRMMRYGSRLGGLPLVRV